MGSDEGVVAMEKNSSRPPRPLLLHYCCPGHRTQRRRQSPALTQRHWQRGRIECLKGRVYTLTRGLLLPPLLQPCESLRPPQ